MKYKTHVFWWLLAIPAIVLSFSIIWGIFCLLPIGFLLIKQAKKKKQTDEFLKEFSEEVKLGEINYWSLSDTESVPLNDCKFRDFIRPYIRETSYKSLVRITESGDIFDNPSVGDYLDGIDYEFMEDKEEKTLEEIEREMANRVIDPREKVFWEKVESLLKEIESDASKRIEDARSVGVLDEIWEELNSRAASDPQNGGELIGYIDFLRRMKSLIKNRIEGFSVAELELPYTIECRTIIDYDLSTDDLLPIYEDTKLNITEDNLMWNTSSKHYVVPLKDAEVLDKDGCMNLTHVTLRENVEYEFAGTSWFIPVVLIQRLSESAKQQNRKEKNCSGEFVPIEVNNPIANSKVCYYMCQAIYVQKVLEEDGDFKCIGNEKECTVYVFSKTLEFVSADSHASINLLDILSCNLNAFEDVLRIVRRNYATALGFKGDVVKLHKAIMYAQNRLMK